MTEIKKKIEDKIKELKSLDLRGLGIFEDELDFLQEILKDIEALEKTDNKDWTFRV